MKESSFNIAQTGLRSTPHDEFGMEVLANLIPRVDGKGKPYYHVPPTFSPVQVTGTSFPFPQLVRGQRITFVLIADRLGYLDETAKSVSWFPFSNVAADGVWSVADFGDSWVIMNPSYTALCVLDANGISTYLSPTSGFQCCCVHDRRLLCADNTGKKIHWGSTLGDDFQAMLSVAGAARTTAQKERNDFASIPTPYRGATLAMKLIGDDIVAYGQDGIVLLRRDNQNGYGLILPTGIPSNVGLHNALAVAGGEDGHIFLGSDNILYAMAPGGAVKKLGYQEFLGTMTDPVLAQDPVEGDVWVSDAATAYCFGQGGLGGPLSIAPYSFVRLSDGILLRTGRPYNAGDAAIAEIVSNVFDWGESARNLVTVIQVGSKNLQPVNVGVLHRYTSVESWRDSRMYPCNKEGWGHVRVRGIQCKARITGTLKDFMVGGSIHRVEVRYQRTDRRGRRGTMTGAGAGQAVQEE